MQQQQIRENDGVTITAVKATQPQHQQRRRYTHRRGYGRHGRGGNSNSNGNSVSGGSGNVGQRRSNEKTFYSTNDNVPSSSRGGDSGGMIQKPSSIQSKMPLNTSKPRHSSQLPQQYNRYRPINCSNHPCSYRPHHNYSNHNHSRSSPSQQTEAPPLQHLSSSSLTTTAISTVTTPIQATTTTKTLLPSYRDILLSHPHQKSQPKAEQKSQTQLKLQHQQPIGNEPHDGNDNYVEILNDGLAVNDNGEVDCVNASNDYAKELPITTVEHHLPQQQQPSSIATTTTIITNTHLTGAIISSSQVSPFKQKKKKKNKQSFSSKLPNTVKISKLLNPNASSFLPKISNSNNNHSKSSWGTNDIVTTSDGDKCGHNNSVTIPPVDSTNVAYDIYDYYSHFPQPLVTQQQRNPQWNMMMMDDTVTYDHLEPSSKFYCCIDGSCGGNGDGMIPTDTYNCCRMIKNDIYHYQSLSNSPQSPTLPQDEYYPPYYSQYQQQYHHSSVQYRDVVQNDAAGISPSVCADYYNLNYNYGNTGADEDHIQPTVPLPLYMTMDQYVSSLSSQQYPTSSEAVISYPIENITYLYQQQQQPQQYSYSSGLHIRPMHNYFN